ncbi:hypothetical protein [Aeoliella straminimaris]|nr:hypothetical protein [Aeoliella straminimaris]
MHSILGCCAHAAHDDHDAHCEHLEAGGSSNHAEHPHHRGETGFDHAVASNCHAVIAATTNHNAPHSCQHPRCAWHAPEVWGAGWANAFVDCVTLPVLCEAGCTFAVSSPSLPEALAGNSSIAPPVRSHLLKSVLLI